jgi:hypothetical protein
MKFARIAIVVVAMLAAARGEASEALKAIVQSYVTIQSQLASDKVDDVKGQARAIAAQAKSMGNGGADIAKAANSLEAAADLKAAREAFAALTTAVLAAGKAEGWKDVEGVRLAFCPMVDRSWLQKDDKIRNPYYGSQMLTCGEFRPLKK